jgi:hypothetical protein
MPRQAAAIDTGVRTALAGKDILDTSHPNGNRDGAMAADAKKLGAGATTPELLQSWHVVHAFNRIAAASVAGGGFRQPDRLVITIGGEDGQVLQIARDWCARSALTRASFARWRPPACSTSAAARHRKAYRGRDAQSGGVPRPAMINTR